MKKKETLVKINKAKSWFFEKIHKIDKLIKKKKKKQRERCGLYVNRGEWSHP